MEINFLLGGIQRRYLWLLLILREPTHSNFFHMRHIRESSATVPIYRGLFFYLFASAFFSLFSFAYPVRVNLITGYGNTTLLISAGQACSYGKIKVGSAEICGKRKRKRKEDVCKRRNREIQNRNQPRNTITVQVTITVVVDYDSWQPHPTIL